MGKLQSFFAYNRYIIVSGLLFVCSILLLSGIDHVVHTDLYSYGLRFSMAWANSYWTLYTLILQIVVIACVLIGKNLKLLIVYEAFVLSKGQDLIYYLVWNNGVFPSGNWEWQEFYAWFGKWNTLNQVSLVASALLLSSVILCVTRNKSVIGRKQ